MGTSYSEPLAEIVTHSLGSLEWQSGIAGGNLINHSPGRAGWTWGEEPQGVWSSEFQAYFCS